MSSFENWKPAPSVLVVIVEAMLLKETGFFLANRQIRGRRGLTSTDLVPLPYLVVWPSTELIVGEVSNWRKRFIHLELNNSKGKRTLNSNAVKLVVKGYCFLMFLSIRSCLNWTWHFRFRWSSHCKSSFLAFWFPFACHVSEKYICLLK